jgi:hypothetical protein
MPQLEYIAQDGQVATVRLPNTTGTTAWLFYYEYERLFAQDAQSVWQSFEHIGADWQMREGDHGVFQDPSGFYLVVVVRPSATKADLRKADRGQHSLLSAEDTRDQKIRSSSLLLHRSRREWLLVINDARTFLIDNEVAPPLRILKDGTKIQLDGWQVTFRELVTGQVYASLLTEPDGLQTKYCPYCRWPFEVGEEYIVCPSCGTVQHAECWHDNGDRCCGPVGCQYSMQLPHAKDGEAS